jgi:hypothetical protein
MRHRVVRQKFTYASEERNASIFRVEYQAKKATSKNKQQAEPPSSWHLAWFIIQL